MARTHIGGLTACFFSVLMLVLALGGIGCSHEPEPTPRPQVTAPPPQPKPAPVVTPAPVVAPKPEAGTTAIAYPTLDRATSYALIETKVPVEVRVGQPFDMTIVVSNLSSSMYLTDVVVTDPLPDGYKMASADPSPASTEGNTAKWNLGRIGPKQSKTIVVKGSASQAGTLVQCASLSCIPQACTEIVAVAPALRLVKTAPQEALVCDAIPVKFIITNSGSGTVRNARIRDALPAGVVTDKGATSIDLDAGTLAAGQSREFTVNLKASKTGTFENKAVASADGGLSAESATKTVVRQPILAITKTGRPEQYVGRSVVYEMTVTNNGDWTAKDTILVDTIPANAKFVEASAGGRAVGNRVQWALGDLAPKASKKVTLTLTSAAVGTVRNTATASAYCADPVNAAVETQFKGIPAVLLEVVDISDPIEIGQEETYEIVVTNQGSAMDTDISIVCTLEDSVNYVSGSGATNAQAQVITFAPLRSLAPKAKATWKVVVKGTKAGDTRFKVSMKTGQTERPVEETESTRFYE